MAGPGRSRAARRPAFNGTTGYLSTGLNFSSDWTALSFAAFALIPSGTTQVCGLVGSNNAAAGGGAYLQLLDSGGSLALQFNVGTASATFVSNATWADGNWHHVAVSFDGSTAIGYLDGVQIGTSGTALTASVTPGSADVTVGAAGGDFLAGGLAQVLVTNWALATASTGLDDGVEPGRRGRCAVLALPVHHRARLERGQQRAAVRAERPSIRGRHRQLDQPPDDRELQLLQPQRRVHLPEPL